MEDILREALADGPFFRNSGGGVTVSGGEIHLPREGWQLFIEKWSEAMLKVYLENLEEAETRGRNLPSKKYACIDNLIPALSDNPASGDGREFSVYLRFYLCCELETYGDRTLQLYCENVRNAEAHLASSGA